MWPRWGYGALVAGIACCAAGVQAEEGSAPVKEVGTVQDGMNVQMDYTLTVEGKIVDSSQGRGPLKYVQGQGHIIPGLERELLGMHVGDSKDVTVKPEDGYGTVDPQAFIEIPREQLPPNLAPEVGGFVQGMTPGGKQFQARVHEVRDKTVMLDLNHPLAGKTLQFNVKIVDVSPAGGAPQR